MRSHIGRYGLRLTQGGGQLGDLYVSVEEVEHVLEGRGAFDLAGQLGLGPASPSGAPPCPPDSPLARLVARFDLDPLDVALLAAAAGAGLSVDVARLYGFAWADFAVKLPPAAFLAELVSDTPDDVPAALRRLRPDGCLRRSRLVRLLAPERWGGDEAIFPHHGALVPDPVLAFLRDEPPLTAGPLHRPDDPPPRFEPPAEVTRRLAALLDTGPVVVLGSPGSGRSEAARVVCARRDQDLLVVRADRLPVDPTRFDAALADALLEARMHGLAVLVQADALLAATHDPRIAAFEHRVEQHRGPLMISAREVGSRLTGAALVECPRADATAQKALWSRELTDDALAERLTARYDLTPGALLDALAEARREAVPGGGDVPDIGSITQALRRHLRRALDGLSEPVETTLGWQDVVLPDDVIEKLHEIRAHARHRTRVFDTWGFRRKMTYGRGLGCLFSGPPGTGKTMMAGILAHDLGREAYRVDLSRVVSKWVGETEKNLARIFDEAEQAQVILLFDEADSLFSTRTEVKGANDRFANMEVNFLLQRMERYDGISILTTNFERSLDEAFRRRLKFRVHFPLPDAAQRAELWQRTIPPEMPVEGTIDFDRLGRVYKMSGGNIKNAILRAAFYAAEEGGGLNPARLQRAAEAESREMGRL